MMRRKETSLLVESWRSFINEGDSSFQFTDHLDGGVMEAFFETEMGKSVSSVQKDLDSDLSYQKLNGHHGKVSTNDVPTNIERSGLKLQDLKKYRFINDGEFGRGVYYVTPTGVWCCPLIQGNVNTANACNQFAAFLRTIGFEQGGGVSRSGI